MTADNQKIPIRERKSYNVPTVWPAGDTITWDVSVPNYAANDPDGAWTLKYEVLGSGSDLGTFTASADGADFTVTIAAATTASYAAGEYTYFAYVSKGSERYKVDEGTITVETNFATASSFDGRSHAKIVYDSIISVIEGRASKDQESYTIAGRSLSRTPIADLILLRDRYKAEVIREERADRIKRGLGHEGRILTRFTPPS